MRGTTIVVAAILVSGSYHPAWSQGPDQTSPPRSTSLPSVDEQRFYWIVENAPADTVTVSNGTMTIAAAGGLVRARTTCLRGSALSVDVRLVSPAARGQLLFGPNDPEPTIRGYALNLPAGGDAPQDPRFEVLRFSPMAMATLRKPPEDWVHYEISCDPGRVLVTVDDRDMIDDRRPGSAGGWFGVRADTGSIMVRSLRISSTLRANPFTVVPAFNTRGVEFGSWVRGLVNQVKDHWQPGEWSPTNGHVVLTCNIQKNGQVTDLMVSVPSSIDRFNKAAYEALSASSPTLPLPATFPEDHLFLTMTFYYNE